MTTLLRFLFGSGWQVLWYVVFWLSSLLFMAVPMKQYWDYVREGKEAGPAALATMMVLMMVVLWTGVTTGVAAAMFTPALAASPWVKVMFVLAAASVAGIAPLPAGYPLAQRPSWAGYALTFGPALATIVASLLLMHWGRSWPAASVPLRPGAVGWVALTVLALPAILLLLMILITVVVMPLQAMVWRRVGE